MYGQQERNRWTTVGLPVLLSMLAVSVAQAQLKSPASSWKVEWERTLAAAKKEGKVIVFGPPGSNARQALAEGFQKAFPDLQVEYTGATGAQTAPRILSERKAGLHSVDVHVGGTTTMLESLLPARALDPIGPALMLPEVTDPTKWWEGKLDYSDKEEKYNLVFNVAVKVPIAINPQMVKPEEIRSYRDLLNPKWSEKIAMRDPTGAGPGLATATFWYAHPRLGKEVMRDFFTKQKVALSRDDRQLLEWVVRGRYAIVVAPSELEATELKSKGVQVELGGAEQLKEGSYLTAAFGSAALVNRAPHANAARIYINWLLSREGQTLWSQLSGYASRRLDVPKDHINPMTLPKDGIEYQPNYKEEYVRLREEILMFLKEIIQK